MNKKVQILGIVSSIILIVVGILLPVPKKQINTYSFSDEGYYEYVGGDAYNIQIESSLRGGIIAGRTVAKAVLISVGVLELYLVFAIHSILHYVNSIDNKLSTFEKNILKSDKNTLQNFE